MAQEIQIFSSGSADFEQTTELDNIICTIRLTYNVRNETWKMNIITENYELTGLKLVINYPMLAQHKALFPELPGDIFILPTIDNPGNFDYDSLGDTYGLVYYTRQEYLNWRKYNGI